MSPACHTRALLPNMLCAQPSLTRGIRHAFRPTPSQTLLDVELAQAKPSKPQFLLCQPSRQPQNKIHNCQAIIAPPFPPAYSPQPFTSPHTRSPNLPHSSPQSPLPHSITPHQNTRLPFPLPLISNTTQPAHPSPLALQSTTPTLTTPQSESTSPPRPWS